MRRLTTLLLGLALLFSVHAFSADKKEELSVNKLFSHHTVLQRDREIPVWGKAPAGEKVTVELNENTAETVTGENGKWMVRLPALPVGGPHELKISGANKTIKLTDILMGDVWLCSGQSNMGVEVRSALNAEEEIAAANYPRIRLFMVERLTSETPKETVHGRWKKCLPKTVANFSAVAYFFGRDLQKAIDVPIGLINANWGGTCAEAWSPESVLISEPEVKPFLDRFAADLKVYPEKIKIYDAKIAEWKKAKAAKDKDPNAPDPGRKPKKPVGPKDANGPSRLYNAMIHPLIPYGIKGVIWYQGEHNTMRGRIYRKVLGNMVKGWRKNFGQGDFPFLVVQLASYLNPPKEPGDAYWPELRESQALCCKDLPNMGLALAIDVGDAKNIHPKNKQTVGARLSLAARAIAYGEDIVYSGPVYKSMEVKGPYVRLSFDHIGGGLLAKDGPLKTFAIAGKDKKFYWAEAKIVGLHVVLRAKEVSHPVAVRYAWATNPEGCNLYNAEGLPAVPFRTDTWPGKTDNSR